jgi:hypothetical protein
MPKSWPEKSTKAMKLISLKQSLPRYAESTPSFDWEDESGEQSRNGSKGEPEQARDHTTSARPLPPSRLSNLPHSYWLGQERPSSNSTLPKCKDRLTNSPFGDHKKLIRNRQLKARQAREAQHRLLKSDTNKTLPASLPRPRGVKHPSNSSNQTASTSTASISDQLPTDVKKQTVVAERLFGFGAGGSAAGAGDLSPIAQLSYEERLTVMMMQIRESSYETVS